MIDRLSHASIYVLDQERAKTFYTEKLGFEVRMDVTMGNFRWLTVGPPGQPELQIVLMPVQGSPMQGESKASLRTLVQSGELGMGVFATRDCRKTYAELKAKGVEFKSEPEERPYGVEATFVDDSGNVFSLTQPK
ncbi:MAG: VOC family protein [Polyangiaceae bacterium]|nr:VOC family protein [Polyangiaceae bacterium]